MKMKNFVRNYPQLTNFFSFSEFNHIQQTTLPKIFNHNENIIVSAPTSSGKTVIFQLAILKEKKNRGNCKCLYLAPIKSLCHQKFNQWRSLFKNQQLKVIEVTGDNIQNEEYFMNFDITIATPEKIDYLSRQNLQFLRSLNLLLIDQVHMLNVEERGATLEAIVSRIMSLNKQIRIIAVSATIPNIYEVAEWLRVPSDLICIFNEEYRPVKIDKIVLGFKMANNPFTFQKVLNYKLLDTIRMYSRAKGTLVFCPTQKGTESACQQIIAQMKDREFVNDDKQLMALIHGAKMVTNNTLQAMIPQGLAFHNAGLSMQDRSIVEKLFLDLKIKILCTTSTLSMGINLPARLVIIKSTKCYKGSMKGYQEYSRIQMDQMMGRAGRPPFDVEGTVVIMTEKENYNRYLSKAQLEPLESQLYPHLLEHVNAEISLHSINSFQDVIDYFRNSFCYIRMKKSPQSYGVKGDILEYTKQCCLKCIETLAKWNIINFSQNTGFISARPLSNSISKSAIEVNTIIKIINTADSIKSQRQYLSVLCQANQIDRFRSKIQERKTLKQINDKNKYILKESISNTEKKSFVLIQAELSKKNIDHWQLRKQAGEILYFMKRLNYCVKTVGIQTKSFWLYVWACIYQKYFNERYWGYADIQILKQIKGLNDKWKILSGRGITNIADLKRNLDSIASICQKNQQFANDIKHQLESYQHSYSINLVKDQATLLKIKFITKLNQKFRGMVVIVGDSKNSLYHYRYMNQNTQEITVAFTNKTLDKYTIALIKDGIIGFDEFYSIQNDTLEKISLNPLQDYNEKIIRKSLDINKKKEAKEKKSQSADTLVNQQQGEKKIEKSKRKNQKALMIKEQQSEESLKKKIINSNVSTIEKKRSKQLKLPSSFRVREPLPLIGNQPDEQDTFLKKKMKKDAPYIYKPLTDYNWKPGFQQINEASMIPATRKIKFGDDDQSKKRITKINETAEKKIQENEKNSQDVFSYFYNLF